MPILLFSINPAAVGQLHDILACLSKFNEDISIEATQSELRISSLNVSKTAYAAFTLNSNSFFEKYHFSLGQHSGRGAKIWACKLQNRALASIFRKRFADSKDKENGLERCEFELQTRANLPECRIIIRLVCYQGIVKTYRLTYENGEMLHASFDRTNSSNTWMVSSRTLADVVEYFGPKTEQLDWFLKDGKVTFTSYTEKVQNGKEILKQPMHTSVALEKRDFEGCTIEEGMHIGIIVKDFRAIVGHAVTLHAHVSARYSRGNRPMQIGYNVGGLQAEFTLMTRGTSKLPSGTTAGTPARDLSVQPRAPPPQLTRDSSEPSNTSNHHSLNNDRGIRIHVQPEIQANRPRQATPSATAASINPDSLFIPADGDDRQWDEPTYTEDAQDFVTWDASENATSATSMRRLRDSEQTSLGNTDLLSAEPIQAIAPTQRLSQVRGLFD